MDGVAVCVQVHMCMQRSQQVIGVLLYHSLLQCPESGSLTEQVPVVQASRLASLCPPLLGLQECMLCLAFDVGSGDLGSIPQVLSAISLFPFPAVVCFYSQSLTMESLAAH